MKTKKILKSLFWVGLCLLLLPGFRSIPNGNNWDIANATDAERKLFIIYTNGTDSITNDIPSGDSLAGVGGLTVDQVVTSILSDFNVLAGAFVILANTSDADYASRGTNRTIDVAFTGAGGANAGEAQQKVSGDQVVGCNIVLEKSLLNSAKDLLRTLTHEIGHCLGLDHPQEITNSIMSYYSDSDVMRLQIDDKMGLVHLYPTDKASSKEVNTYGFSCARQ